MMAVKCVPFRDKKPCQSVSSGFWHKERASVAEATTATRRYCICAFQAPFNPKHISHQNLSCIFDKIRAFRPRTIAFCDVVFDLRCISQQLKSVNSQPRMPSSRLAMRTLNTFLLWSLSISNCRALRLLSNPERGCSCSLRSTNDRDSTFLPPSVVCRRSF